MIGLLLAASLAAPSRYCEPVALRDYEVIVGRVARVRVTPGCTKPALLRKVSTITGRHSETIVAPVNKVTDVGLFMQRLEYTLDGLHWKTLTWSGA